MASSTSLIFTLQKSKTVQNLSVHQISQNV